VGSPRKIPLGVMALALIVAVGATAFLSSSTQTTSFQLTTIGPPHDAGQCAEDALADPLAATVNVTIAADSYYYTYGLCSANLGLYGNFDVNGGLEVKFFICDRANFNLWTDGYPASVYLQNAEVSSLEWTFKVPKTDIWYIVYANEYYLYDSVDVAGHHYLDTTPPVIEWNLANGAACSGIKDIAASITEARFDVASVRLSIDGVLVDTEYDGFFTYSWNSADVGDGIHTIAIEAEDTIGNMARLSVQVSVNNIVPSFPLMTVAGIGVFGVVAAALVLGRRSPARIETQGAVIRFTASGPEPVSRPGFCPYCGTPVVLANARFCPECGTRIGQQ